MNRIILADDQAIFRVGMATILAAEDNLWITAECSDIRRLYHAIALLGSSIVIFASSMNTDLAEVIAAVQSAASRAILIAENGYALPPIVLAGLHGLVYRDVSSTALVKTVRKVIRDERSIHSAQAGEDPVGAQIRDRLAPRELKVLAMILRGYKNREIGLRLGTTEQVIKNYLSGIYYKTGVSDRVKLARFTFHHPTLAEAVTSAGIP
jgi:DNA-binding NarL/FixJ family response regulator